MKTGSNILPTLLGLSFLLFIALFAQPASGQFKGWMDGDYEGAIAVDVTCPNSSQTTNFSGTAKVHLNHSTNQAMTGTLSMTLPVNGSSSTGTFVLSLTNPAPFPGAPPPHLVQFAGSANAQTSNFLLNTGTIPFGLWGTRLLLIQVLGAASYNNQQCTYVGQLNVKQSPMIQLVCRHLSGNILDLNNRDKFTIENLTQSIGRHCYFLITKSAGLKETIGAYNRGNLAPEYMSDSTTPLGGCIPADTKVGDYQQSVCINLNSCASQDAYGILLEGLFDLEQDEYNIMHNNCNTWAKKRLAEIGCSAVAYPSSAPSNDVEFCAQLNSVRIVKPWVIDLIKWYNSCPQSVKGNAW